jgi:hypothetical protein
MGNKIVFVLFCNFDNGVSEVLSVLRLKINLMVFFSN